MCIASWLPWWDCQGWCGRGLGLTEEAGWLGCSYCTLCFQGGEGSVDCVHHPLPPRECFRSHPPHTHTHCLEEVWDWLFFFLNILAVLLNHGFSLVPQGDQGRCGLWDLGLTEVAGWLLCVGSAPVQFIKGG